MMMTHTRALGVGLRTKTKPENAFQKKKQEEEGKESKDPPNDLKSQPSFGSTYWKN
jgi:hypothetical protein